MKALENSVDIIKYSQKLNNLDDDNLFLIASSLNAEAYEKKVYTINSIINRIKLLSSNEFIEFDKQINEILKKKNEEKLLQKEKVEFKILLSDRIFFIFAPNINIDKTKIFYYFAINAYVTFNFIFSIIILYSTVEGNINLSFMVKNFFYFFCSLFLFISMTNEISSFAKISLLGFEIFLLIGLFDINFKLMSDIIIFSLFFLNIYTSYIQLIVTKKKELKII